MLYSKSEHQHSALLFYKLPFLSLSALKLTLTNLLPTKISKLLSIYLNTAALEIQGVSFPSGFRREPFSFDTLIFKIKALRKETIFFPFPVQCTVDDKILPLRKGRETTEGTILLFMDENSGGFRKRK